MKKKPFNSQDPKSPLADPNLLADPKNPQDDQGEIQTPAVTFLNSCVNFCDVVIAGKGNAAALKYDGENMFAPMSVMLEKDVSAETLIHSAEVMGIPIIKNIFLAKNLVTYGKVGKSIPESAYQDVSLLLMRLGSRKPVKKAAENSASLPGYKTIRKVNPIRIPRPLSLELGSALYALCGEGQGRKILLADPLDAIRKKLTRLLGFSIKRFRIAPGNGLREDEYRIFFRGLEAGRGKVEVGWYITRNIILPPLKVPRNFAGVSIPTHYKPDLMTDPENIGAAAKAAASAVIRHVNDVILRRAPELLGRDEVEAILDAAEEKYPVVTGEVKSLLPLGIIREILQNIVSEQVSIRHIIVILETLADWSSFGPAPGEMIIEQVRQALKRQICLEYVKRACQGFKNPVLLVLTLEPEMERGFTEQLSDQPGPSGIFHSKGGHISEECIDAIVSAAKKMEEKKYPPLVLCSPAVRSLVKEATRRKFPGLAVLSYTEIPPDIDVKPVGTIRL